MVSFITLITAIIAATSCIQAAKLLPSVGGAQVTLFSSEKEFKASKDKDPGLPIVLKNHGNETVYAVFKTQEHSAVNGKVLTLPVGQVIRLGKMPKTYFGATLHAMTGCNEDGQDCDGIWKSAALDHTVDPTGSLNGQVKDPSVQSLFEWSTVDNMMQYDLSFVDGYNINMVVSFDNKHCAPLGCNATHEEIMATCPAKNVWHSDNNGGARTGCRSDCKLHNTDFLCCRGGYSSNSACPKSSSFFETRSSLLFLKQYPPPKPNFINKDGALVRPTSAFRSWISSSPGSQYTPEKSRYHLYISYACPWGWRFPTPEDKCSGELSSPDPLHEDVKEMRDLYFKASPGYTGRYTVPVLWDKKTESIVSNESSEIIRMLNSEFNSILPERYRSVDLYPESLRSEIDEVNEWMYHEINNGVYKSGIARSQEAYDVAVASLFTHLDRVETHLHTSQGPYYLGTTLTEIDVRLFVTIIRFDPVYVGLFKCNIRDIRSGYPAIHSWLRNLYWDNPAFKSTTLFDQIKDHYMKSLTLIMPAGIVSAGPLPHILPKEKNGRTSRVGRRDF
ncbi:hypothetical protein B7494_g603 [Chlorociboria aeruginascens]|nr:hypothetical protein B7494_g603 [Chlorociboria aeruginascens]